MLLPFLQGCSLFSGPKLLWHAPIASTMKPIVQNGQLYVSGFRAGHPGESPRLFALDAATGKENWVSADSVDEVYGESAGYVFFRNINHQLVQLEARTGKQLYVSADSTHILKWAIRGDLMYIVNAAMEVVAVNNRLSQVIWRQQLPAFCNYNLTTLDLADQKVIVSGLLHIEDEMYGKVWAFDIATGQELWQFEPPKPRSYAALDVFVHNTFVVATNTSPIHLETYVLDLRTGRKLYPPIINACDFYGSYGNVAYSPNGNIDLPTGQRTDNKASWMANSIIHNGIAWQRYLGTAGVLKGFFLRTVYDGDVRGSRNWYDTPPKSSFKGYDVVSGEEKYQTKGNTYAQFSEPVELDGVLYHSSIALMKEGESGVWAYRLP